MEFYRARKSFLQKKGGIKTKRLKLLFKANPYLFLLFIFLTISLLFLLSCQPKGELAYEEEELEPEIIQEEVEEAKVPARPKMTEELYIDLTARSALIWDKYKEEPEKAQQEVDDLYLRAGVTWKEYKEFESKLTPQQRDALQKKIMDYMQKIIHEYR